MLGCVAHFCSALLRRVQLVMIPSTIGTQAPPSMGSSRQEHWSGLLFLLRGIFLTQGWILCFSRLLHSQLDFLPLAPPGRPTFGSEEMLCAHTNADIASPWSLVVPAALCSVVSNSVTPGTVACQAPLSVRFSRPGYWSGLPFPPPGHLPGPGIELGHCCVS